MKASLLTVLMTVGCVCACHKLSPPASPNPSSSRPADAVEQKLAQYAGPSATNCGRLDTHATTDQSRAASDCAIEANQGRRPFFVAYDMPGLTVGVAGNSEGKLFTLRSEGSGPSATVSAGDCPSALRVAGSGRVTCYSPGDMGSMGAGHTAIPPGMPNPHAMPKVQDK